MTKFIALLVMVTGATGSICFAAEKEKSPKITQVNAATAGGAEKWKGERDASQAHFGGLLGLGILDAHAGFAVIGTASKKIIPQGWVEDINNSVSLELQAGPLFVSGLTFFDYSVHLRWDFQQDEQWTFYALGGLGGMAGHDRFPVYPRFGIGTIWNQLGTVAWRAEISHELIAAGISFPVY